MKKTITITLYLSELVYDVQNKTYLTGRNRLEPDGSNQQQIANMQATDDDENANQVMRSIGNAWATLTAKLSEYLVSADTTSNDMLLSGNNLVVALQMPSNYNESVNDTLSAAMHQYVVNLATADWYELTSKEDAADYMTMAAANLGQVKECINKRVRPVREEVI